MKTYFSFLLIVTLTSSLFGQENEVKKISDTLQQKNIIAKNSQDNSTNKDDYGTKAFNVTTPEVSQLIKSEIIPINYVTGKAEYTIPLYEVKEGDISIPIQLKYSSNGVKVAQESTNVGLDWVLVAGGNVTKFVNDIDDQKYRVNQNESIYTHQEWSDVYGWYNVHEISDDWGQYISKRGRLVNDSSIEYVSDTRITPNSSNYEQILDLAPDSFIAIAPNLTSKFFLQKKTSLENNWDSRYQTFSYKGHEIQGYANQIYVNKYDKFDITGTSNNGWMGWNTVFPPECSSKIGNLDSYVQNNFSLLNNKAKDYDQFEIINASGNIYSFKTNDVNIQSSTESPFFFTDYSPKSDQSGRAVCKHILNNNYNISINTWHLDSVLDITSNKKVTFKYKEFKESRNKLIDYDKGYVVDKYFSVNGYIRYPSVPYQNYENKKYSQNSIYHYVEEINWSEGKVKFFYDISRTDAFDDNNKLIPKRALSQVIIYDISGNVIKKIKLSYSYFTNSQGNTDLDLRLKLNTVGVYDKNDVKSYNYILEYNESPMPSKGTSVATKNYRDIFGYFKAFSPGSFPKSFYKLNQRFSFVNLPLNNFTFLYGDIDMSPDSNVSIGMLKKVITPTGGSHQFFYEPNKFIFNNQEIIGGGARLMEQRISNGNTERKITYKYSNQNGESSGRISNLPSNISYKTGDVVDDNSNHSSSLFPAIYLSQQNSSELDNGSYVLYEKVTEEEAGNGKQVFSFTGYSDYPNTYPNIEDHSGGMYSSPFIPLFNYYNDRSHLRSQLLKKEVYSEGRTFPSRMETYQYKLATDNSSNFNVLFLSSYLMKPSWDLIINNAPENLLLYKKLVRKNYLSATNFTQEEELNKDYYGAIPFYQNNSEEPAGYTYTDVKFFPKSKKITNSDGSILETFNDYALDKNNIYLTSLNIIGIPLDTKVIKKKDNSDTGKTISHINTIYPSSNLEAINKTSGLPLPSSIQSTDLQSVTKEEINYNKYDEKGNLQQYTTKNGTPVAIIWGYRKTLPIAKIEGKDAALFLGIFDSDITILSNSSDSDINLATEDEFRLKLDAFQKRQFNLDVSITTYTHNPLVGVTSITPPSGIREVYIYDTTNRLKEIRENNTTGKLLKEFKYNYKN
ncbi:hypothetical protein [Chryseobacterium lathyri]|uniref:hypothetical protein n=1 Tax=Chryseobacterium lathyri TaxID=395933 RepID=UPI002781A7FF|nr:hypothetical protein [Chryseobacterium lathyri]MDQ0068187.1 hypothetical protein [Chryseobacterium lathyri]